MVQRNKERDVRLHQHSDTELSKLTKTMTPVKSSHQNLNRAYFTQACIYFETWLRLATGLYRPMKLVGALIVSLDRALRIMHHDDIW